MLKHSITLSDKLILFREFYHLYASGITTLKIFEVLTHLQNKRSIQILLKTIQGDLMAGNNLHTCFSKHPKIFNHIICQLIRIGEASGKLEKVLLDICQYLEKQYQFKQNIKKSLFYPCILVSFGLLTCIFLLVIVIPHFAELFQHSEQTIPAITQYLFSISQLIRNYGFILLGVSLCLGCYLYLSHRSLASLILKSAPVKTILHYFDLAQFSRSLSLSLNAGLRLDLALTLYRSKHSTFNQDLLSLKADIQKGLTLEQSMQNLASFPTAFRQMIHIGETSGTLTTMLEQLVRLYEEKFQNYLTCISQLLEPLIILGLGVLIGGLVISMYLPIFNLGQVL